MFYYRCRTGHARHVAERGDGHLGHPRERDNRVDVAIAGDANRAPRAARQARSRGHEVADAVARDGYRVRAAHLHERRAAFGREFLASPHEVARELRVLELRKLGREIGRRIRRGCRGAVGRHHANAPSALGLSSGSSSISAISWMSSSVSSAYCRSTISMANPACTSTKSPTWACGVRSSATSRTVPMTVTAAMPPSFSSVISIGIAKHICIPSCSVFEVHSNAKRRRRQLGHMICTRHSAAGWR